MSSTKSQSRRNSNPGSAATVVMAATLVSRLLGFLRTVVITAIFGASGSADVLNAVFNIPNNLRKLLAEGALSSAFIPVLSQSLADEQQRSAGIPRLLVRNLLSFQAIILVPVLVLSVVFARPITSFILDFPEAERQLLAADLFRWVIHYTLLISISAVLMGSLNSSNRFAIPAFTPIVFSVFVIGSVLLLHEQLGIYSMAVGILVGGIGQVFFQTPQFIRSGFDFRPSFAFGDPLFRKILHRWLPVVAASGVFVINQQFALYFASGLEDGSSSALLNAIVFWQLPLAIFSMSVTTVLFPRMSREATSEDISALRGTVAQGVRAIAALLIPSAIVLATLSYEVIAVVLQRGRFTEQNTFMTARVLIAYCAGLPSVGLFGFLQRSSYSRGDYRTPTLAAFIVLVLDVVLSLVLKETSLRVVGLAAANSIAFSVGAVLLMLSSRKALKGLEGGRILRTLLKTAVAAAPVLMGLLIFRQFWGDLWTAGSTLANLARLAATGGGSVMVIALLYWLLRNEAVTILLRRGAK